jgi:hypothetical protein
MFAAQLEQLIGSHLGKMPLEFILLSRAWKEVVGERVAAHTMPAWIRSEVLWVFVDGSGWMQELTFMKLDILEQVNNKLRLTSISDIRWLQQQLEDKPFCDREFTMPDRDLDSQQEEEFSEMTKIIGDSGCQQALLNLWQTFHRKMR